MSSPPFSASTNVSELLKLLTLEEKVSLLSGADGWQTQCIERLGIGSVKTTDGPAGARGKLSVDGPRAAFLPAPVLQAATWSKVDLKTIGGLLCREAKTKAAQVLLAPTICCARNPLGGRNFESYSEDPFLSGSLAIQYVSGLQETGEVVATAKHFVANEEEYERFTINANIDEKTLREIYLRPFEMLIKSASPPGCIMTAYNCVNGLHMDLNAKIIKDILRNEWNFQGLVMSDWGGTNSTAASLIAGCDLEMPGPPEKRGRKLLEAMAKESSPELVAAIDESCSRVLSLAKRMKLLGLSAEEVAATRNREETSSTTKEDLETLRHIAANGHVLLKNSAGTLPLDPHKLGGKKVAFIGPNAQVGTAGGGGSASMNPQYQSQPIDAFKTVSAELGIDVEVNYAMGSYTRKWLPLTSPEQWSISVPTGVEESILKLDFYATGDFNGPIVETQYRNNSLVDLFDSGPASLRESGKPYSLKITSAVKPSTSGNHSFSISSVGNARLLVDGKLLIDNYNWTEVGETFYSYGSVEICQSMDMVAGQSYEVVLECASKEIQAPEGDEIDPIHVFGVQPSVRLGFLEELPKDLIAEAVALSNESDFTVLVLGLNEEWESEGYDRQTMAMPGAQDELVQTLLEKSAHPENIIVVNQSGSPVEMPWADQASTILQAWYGGQEAGNALADVLLGISSPSGHLPISWPRKYSDLHFAKDPKSWPGVDGQVDYVEGTSVGYRWYLRNGTEPQWWFGHGLSYTSFDISELEIVEQAGQGWAVSVRVDNTGSFTGQHVLQVYSWPVDKEEAKELRSFEKTAELKIGDKESVRVQIQLRDMAHWVEHRWVLEAGNYYLGLGLNAGDKAMLKKLVHVKEKMEWQS
ncbi:glycoside hydrolase superfamily [Xylariales sp. PMI_506]|nr:glycoside hydrolase superfamily [Xylariales sp. PMI_506]